MFSPQQEVVLDGELSLDLHIDGDMSLDIPVDGEAGTVIKVTEHDLPVYSGQTEITPSEETQTLQTANKTVLQCSRSRHPQEWRWYCQILRHGISGCGGGRHPHWQDGLRCER